MLVCLALWTSATEADSLTVQRAAFLAADSALQQGGRAVFQSSKASLKDYPLYPYLLYRDLEQRLSETPTDEIRAFLDTYADSPVSGRLRARWLEYLFQQKRWSDFLQDYRADGNVEMDCRYRQVLLHEERKQEALSNIESIWISGRWLPDACDPVFKVWKNQGGITQERIWKRFELAMQAGNLRLARYLRSLLGTADRSIAELWIQAHTNPRIILETQRFDPQHPRTPAILLHGLERWSRRDSVSAAPALDLLKQRYRLPQKALSKLERNLALYLAARGHPDALARLEALPPVLVDTAVEEWRVRAGGLQKNNWRATLKWLDRMSPANRDSLQWRYWRARALEATGHSEEARSIYRSLAEERDYYGFLAADRLNLPYQLNNAPLQFVAEELNELLARLPGLQRARELFFFNRAWEGRLEWNQSIDMLKTDDLKKAARLAHDWGWHDRAVSTLARAGYWDDLELRFPLPHRERVLASSASETIDAAWIYAIMRQESLFRPDARSGAGALGLMQIMPATGRLIARDLNMRAPNQYGLLQTDINIRYGAYYLRYTRDKLQNSPLLATAAYNAGPRRVQEWLPQGSPIDADLWVETIPFSETRNYVKRVMEYAVVYERRLGQDGSMQARMERILPENGGL